LRDVAHLVRAITLACSRTAIAVRCGDVTLALIRPDVPGLTIRKSSFLAAQVAAKPRMHISRAVRNSVAAAVGGFEDLSCGAD